MNRAVVLTARAQRDLTRLDKAVAVRVIQALERLAESGRGDVRRLKGTTCREWRLRVGAWRVRFALERDR
ncbi:MAG: type II toxin-antitoxin system RelE/ParE family toxin, partial [Gemmatimonadetes bacterium]|nr:type II toxin-antitoxin system RelE/ParE family toxin [Gemmatimonadota bacterium]